MNGIKKGARRGFSLVELLAVVLILAVLAAVAVPLYINSRKTSAARACLANIAAIAAAEAAYVVRNDGYATMAQLLTAPEGLAEEPVCPLRRGGTGKPGSYTITLAGGAATISCPNAASDHAPALTGSSAIDWQKELRAPAADTDSFAAP
jgi:prepilin-type N-terminal cleavage/methylation domain-containing protein